MDDTACTRPPNERRQAIRFPMGLPVRYILPEGSNWGQTLNISSRGALLTMSHATLPGEKVELYISWPVLLDENVHLSLVVAGAVVRVDERGTAVKFDRCGFRTSSSAFFRQSLLAESGAGENRSRDDPMPPSHE